MLVTAAQIGLTPDEFWSLTPHEFNLAVKGYGKKIEQEQELLAWHAACIINHIPHFGKGKRKAVYPDDLLGRKRKTFADADDFREYMRERAD